ncbi:Mov34/MPN/PAD-1 family protein [Sphingopyxis flava]|uniref:JAB domain-containing protein n=1 Tax=Sphingopyxis flava TaxID=1507287 RepID=A0A1T5CS88_9SPHN|nr:Mov34/MPN/PAD-1 family protein [Sphingopyxis flava]SKB62193.1 JAB domain-containing protein [Sphingopyxis flava]
MQPLIDLYLEGHTVERCGFIFRDGSIVEIDNVHSEPERGFRMDPKQILEHVDNPDLVGTWHTHPGGDPNLSQEDYAGFLSWPHLEHHIVGELRGTPTVESFVIDNGLVLKK